MHRPCKRGDTRYHIRPPRMPSINKTSCRVCTRRANAVTCNTTSTPRVCSQSAQRTAAYAPALQTRGKEMSHPPPEYAVNQHNKLPRMHPPCKRGVKRCHIHPQSMQSIRTTSSRVCTRFANAVTCNTTSTAQVCGQSTRPTAAYAPAVQTRGYALPHPPPAYAVNQQDQLPRMHPPCKHGDMQYHIHPPSMQSISTANCRVCTRLANADNEIAPQNNHHTRLSHVQAHRGDGTCLSFRD
jgi:hypothetical protein